MHRHRRAAWHRLSALLLLVVLVASSCGGGDSTTTVDSESADAAAAESTDVDTVGDEDGDAMGDSLVTAWPNDVSTLDPGWARTDQDKELTFNIYERLVEYQFEPDGDGAQVWTGLDVAPALAESWTTDGATITFTLRDGVTFYPSGNPLTAEDVKFSFTRVVEREGGHGDYTNAGLHNGDQIEVIDDRTVAITFTDDNGTPVEAAASLASLRMPAFGIVDSVAVLENATDDDPTGEEYLASNVAGTGPYYIASHSPGEEIVLEATPDHWAGAVEFPAVTIRVVASANVAALVGQGEVDVATFGLTAKDFSDLESSGFKVIHVDTPDMVYLQLPGDVGPLADQRVRQAIAYALPYDAFIDAAFAGRARRALSYVNAQAPGYVPAWDMYETDLDRAQSLMDEAGVSDLSLTLAYTNASPSYEDMALLGQDRLAQIGIDLTLLPTPYGDVFSMVIDRATAESAEDSADVLAMMTLSIYLDDAKSPVEFYHAGALNYSRVQDEHVLSLHDDLQWAPSSPERVEGYQSIQQHDAEVAGFVPLVTMGRTYALADGITDVSFSPEIATRFWMLSHG